MPPSSHRRLVAVGSGGVGLGAVGLGAVGLGAVGSAPGFGVQE